jgi:cytochrome c oxidase cbb3-type subunit III
MKIIFDAMKFIKSIAALTGIFIFLLSTSANAAENITPPSPVFMNTGFWLLGFILLILLISILVLSKSIVGLGQAVARIKKKSSAVILLVFLTFTANAQQEAVPERLPSTLPAWALNSDLYLLGALFFILALTLYVLFQINFKFIRNLIPEPEKPVEQIVQDVVVAQSPGLLERVYLRLVDSVPVSAEKDILLDHDYDGIKELDNNLPPWWKYGFYATIAFAVGYMVIYHVSGSGKLQLEEYKDELLLAEKQKDERLKASAENVNEETVTALSDPGLILSGKEIFIKNCSACHRNDGGGQVGPNLVDEYWLHGGGIKNIFKTIFYGVPDKGMISWKSQLSPKQIQQVATFILTLKGQTPEGAKEAQGELWVETTDTTGVIQADSSVIAEANPQAISNKSN